MFSQFLKAEINTKKNAKTIDFYFWIIYTVGKGLMEWNLSKDERFYEISRRSRMTVFFFSGENNQSKPQRHGNGQKKLYVNEYFLHQERKCCGERP